MNQFRSNVSKYFFSKIDLNKFKIPKNIPVETSYLTDVDVNTLDRIKNFKMFTKKIPIVINGKSYEGRARMQICPYDNEVNVCLYQHAQEEHIKFAINSHEIGKKALKKLSPQEKTTMFNKLADLFTNDDLKFDMLAATMLGQGKTLHQAEIDAICELGDFLNFNAYFLNRLNSYQPYSFNSEDADNYSSWNPLNGFVASITPFNFTAIGANLASAPLLMNNSVIWKPSDNAILSNYIFFQQMLEVGIPPESISFLPCEPNQFFKYVSHSPEMAGLAFTGSSSVFEHIYKTVGNNISRYNNFPRIIGERRNEFSLYLMMLRYRRCCFENC